MTSTPERVVLLGPQRQHPDAGGVVADLRRGGPVALITAGWQEWEEDDHTLRDALARETFNLRLYGRAEEVWAEDPELAQGHRSLQADVRLLRQAYNIRLARAMDAWTELTTLTGDSPVLNVERDSALAAVQALDQHHAQRLRVLRDGFYAHFDPLMRGAVARQRDDLQRELEGVEVLVLAGGHVPSLLNRLRLFGVDQLLDGKVVVACGGGAMALAPRVVLFHDSPPWGPGHAELGEVGLDLVPGVVALPDGSVRLRLDDPGRVSRLARRFAPDACLLLDPGHRADWDGAWRPRHAWRLSAQGHVQEWRDVS